MIIIDAYNCLHAGSSMSGPWHGFSLRELCRLVERLDKKIVLVMDGSPKPDEPTNAEFPDVTLKYSGRGVSADSVIISMVDQSSGARHITVVSNDRAVKAGAQRGGARTMACEKYLAGILRRKAAMRLRWKTAEPQRKTIGRSSDTDFWLHEFGFATGTRKVESQGFQTKAPATPDDPAGIIIDAIDMEEILRQRMPPQNRAKSRSFK